MQGFIGVMIACANCSEIDAPAGVDSMDPLLKVKLDYVACLSSIYKEIEEDRWPSQCLIDAAVGYATILGISEVEVDRLHAALMY